MSTFNAEVAEAMTYNIIKQTIGHLVEHGMLKPNQRGECLTLFTSMMSKKTRGRPALSKEERAAKKQAAAEKKAQVEARKAARLAKKQAAAEAKAEKALAREAKKQAAAQKKQEAAEAKGEARIVTVASRAHTRTDGIDFGAVQRPTKSTTAFPEYCVSKLANVLFSAELAKRLGPENPVHTYALHPGVVASDIWRRVPWPFRSLMKMRMITNEEGALTSLHCATSPEAGQQTGMYYDKSKPRKTSSSGADEALARELWEQSERWVGRSFFA